MQPLGRPLEASWEVFGGSLTCLGDLFDAFRSHLDPFATSFVLFHILRSQNTPGDPFLGTEKGRVQAMKIELPCRRELNFHIFDKDSKKTKKLEDRRASWDPLGRLLDAFEAS